MPIQYDEIIESNGVKIPFVRDIITPPIEKPMRNGRYEGGECAALRNVLRDGDRVLELGAGVGLLSAIAGQSAKVSAITAVEANPELLPLIRETHRLNDADHVNLINGVVTPEDGEPIDFYLRRDFWASSMESESRPFVKSVKVSSLGIGSLIAENRPTVMLCDIEGGELGLFDNVDLSEVRVLIIEFHPKVYGQANVDAISEMLRKKGLEIEPVAKPTSVRRFVRPDKTKARAPAKFGNERFLVTTCMKDEGPFILEWLAWHKAIGIQDFVVFTNHCTDGTEQILDRLEKLGHLRHMPNPALATGTTSYQPAALRLTPYLSEFKKADYYISMDVDEFINIRVGDGLMSDLLGKVEDFDALSMSELNHGSNGNLSFEPGLVTDQFPRHQTERPGARKALRGVKTIVRISDKLDKPRNHRPDFKQDNAAPVWLDGSGRQLTTLASDPSLNGIDVRGSYELVSLDHYPLRSLESYLIKMFRGDVVVKKNRVSQRYWRVRNRNEELTSNLDRQTERFKKWHAGLLADPELKTFHEQSCEVHKTRAAELLNQPDFRERRDWILENAWPEPVPA